MSEERPSAIEPASNNDRTTALHSSTIERPTVRVRLMFACVGVGGLAALILIGSLRGINSPAFISILFLALASLASLLFTFIGNRTDREADAIRGTVEREAIGDRSITINVADGGTLHYQQHAEDRANTQASDSLQKQEAILREIYTQGLAQARTSFRLSMIFAALGAVILLAGAGLAIMNSNQSQAATLTALSGLVIEIVSSLFFVQSNRANANMIRQGVLLREESQSDRLLNASRQVAGGIEDTKLRDEVRADMAESILRLAGGAAGGQAQGSTGTQT
nr:hypothetical protein [Micromonospora provocatoris]